MIPDGYKLCRATTNYFCAGIESVDGVIIHTAPILSWSIGRSLESLENWLKTKGGKLEEVELIND